MQKSLQWFGLSLEMQLQLLSCTGIGKKHVVFFFRVNVNVLDVEVFSLCLLWCVFTNHKGITSYIPSFMKMFCYNSVLLNMADVCSSALTLMQQ